MSLRSTVSPNGHASLLRIGQIVVDFRYSRVSRDGREIPLPPRAFDLLALFLSRPGVLLSREDIFRLVWKDVLVEDANLTQTVWLLRRALGEEGKSWIRTVSKRGYVFEGPLVEVLDAPDRVESPAVADTERTEEASELVVTPSAAALLPQPVRARSRIPMRIVWLAIAAGVVLLAVLVVRWRSDALLPGNEGRVVIVEAVGENADESVADAVTLAHEWIAWQLGDLGLRDVVTAERSASVGTPNRNDHVLLLSARQEADTSRLIVDAQLIGRRGGGHWLAAGSPGDLPAVIEDLSRRVLDGLRANTGGEVAFDLPKGLAHRYALAIRLRDEGELANALKQLDDVVRQAPQFNLARLELARRLSQLGQVSGAREHIDALSAWIDAQPSPAHELLSAQRAAVRQEFREAAEGYASLARRRPAQWRFKLAEARNLVANDRVDEALDVLGSQGYDMQAAPLQAEWLLLRGQAQLSLGALRLARASAERAAVLSRRDENGDVAARAQVLVALIDVMATGSPADIAALRAAADGLERLGDEFGALRARIAAATLGSTYAKDEARAAIGALLAKARAAGNPRIEIQALRDQSRLALREFDFDAWRRHLTEGRVVAEATGERAVARGIAADLLFDEILRGDYGAAERRGAEWRDAPLQGLDGIELGLNLSLLIVREGRFDDAQTLLDDITRANAKAGEGSAVPTVLATRIDCRRASVRLRQGAIEPAQQYFAACAEAVSPRDRYSAYMGQAMLAMLTGDVEGARARVNAAPPELAQATLPTERATRLAQLVPLLLRLGDVEKASRFVDDDLAYGERGGFRLLQGLAWMRKAEISLVGRDPAAATAAIERARALLPAADWCADADLRLLDAAVALVRGDETRALSGLRRLLTDARARGDIVIEIMAMNLVADRLPAIGGSESVYNDLIASSGLRGASLRWLVHPETR